MSHIQGRNRIQVPKNGQTLTALTIGNSNRHLKWILSSVVAIATGIQKELHARANHCTEEILDFNNFYCLKIDLIHETRCYK